MVNFKWIQPWYLSYVQQIWQHNKDTIVKQAYQLLGGNAFANAEKTSAGGIEDLSTSLATPSSSLKCKASD